MSYLLDTHTLIWALFAPDLLSKRAMDRLRDPDVVVSITVVSLWEISLKYAIGKLHLTGVTPDDFPEIVTQSGFEILELSATEEATFHRLPREKHHDPFDRLILWQAISRKLPLISRDRAFLDYKKFGLKILW